MGVPPSFSFDEVVAAMANVHQELASQASRAVNARATLRNWLFGYYIRDYEQQGTDRATYGERIILRLAGRLMAAGVSRSSARELRRYRQFYLEYPHLRDLVKGESFPALLPAADLDGRLPAAGAVEASKLVAGLSFTHIVELLQCADPTKRAFYEVECLRGNWSVRELKRQMGSLYYERTALSTDKAQVAARARAGAEAQTPALALRDPYVFEFLGLRAQEVMSESHLEDQLLDKLQDFLLELGHGFCFEARQRRILLGDTHYFVDLVFYHRILKCHVLVELKLAAFSHENIGQLNTYVSWYRKHMMSEGDNPPIGILLCTEKDQALIEYALAGMDNGLFVSKYLLELPPKEELQRVIERELAARGQDAISQQTGDREGEP